MSKSDYDWLEDPFNEEKSKQELEEARKSNNRGLLLVLVVAIVVIFVIVSILGSCSASLFMG